MKRYEGKIKYDRILKVELHREQRILFYDLELGIKYHVSGFDLGILG